MFKRGDYVQCGNHIRLIMGVREDGWFVLNTGPDTEAMNLKPCPWLKPCEELLEAIVS